MLFGNTPLVFEFINLKITIVHWICYCKLFLLALYLIIFCHCLPNVSTLTTTVSFSTECQFTSSTYCVVFMFLKWPRSIKSPEHYMSILKLVPFQWSENRTLLKLNLRFKSYFTDFKLLDVNLKTFRRWLTSPQKRRWPRSPRRPPRRAATPTAAAAASALCRRPSITAFPSGCTASPKSFRLSVSGAPIRSRCAAGRAASELEFIRVWRFRRRREQQPDPSNESYGAVRCFFVLNLITRNYLRQNKKIKNNIPCIPSPNI